SLRDDDLVRPANLKGDSLENYRSVFLLLRCTTFVGSSCHSACNVRGDAGRRFDYHTAKHEQQTLRRHRRFHGFYLSYPSRLLEQQVTTVHAQDSSSQRLVLPDERFFKKLLGRIGRLWLRGCANPTIRVHRCLA